MRAVYVARTGGPEVLQVRQVPVPIPQAGEVCVRVCASGLQLADVMARRGHYPLAPKPPCVLGYEVAGYVERAGAGVLGFAVGQRVLAMPHFGGQADFVCIPADRVVPIPENMSFEDAAALPVSYLTARHLLFSAARVRPGDRVLVHMAGGGVGLAVLQLCRTVPGVEVLGTSSASKHELLRAQGCHHPIDYRTRNYAAEVLRITGGQGVDVVLDSLGGRDSRIGFALLRPFGRLVMYGAARMLDCGRPRSLQLLRTLIPALMPAFAPFTLLQTNRSVTGVSLGRHWFEDDAHTGSALSTLVQMYTKEQIRPVIDSVFELADVAAAHQRLELRKNAGKVVLRHAD
ncbi:MAG TPA: medium chain dehydrogenase/reductase family protein [Polyangiales bacterium]|nr:medium chain dehydrogenase/reductase family protein [Polyangiales bacterium]